MPLANEAIASVEAATTAEPNNPSNKPAVSQRFLAGTSRVAAARIPTINAASNTSLNTIIAVANIVFPLVISLQSRLWRWLH